MKTVLLGIAALLLAGCGGTGLVVKQVADADMIPMRDVGTIKNVQELDRYAAYYDQGEHLPLQLDVTTDIIETQEKKIDLVFKKRVYFRVERSQNLSDAQFVDLQKQWADRSTLSDSQKAEFAKQFMLYVSLDGKQWAAVNNPEALRQVLKIGGGNIAFGFGVDGKTGISGKFSLQTIPLLK